MAAAGTLSRPTSAQGSYSAFQTFYAPSSPTLPPGSFTRPSSAGGNYANDGYSAYRKSAYARPSPQRHATSTQHIPTTTGAHAPTRIYGLRTLTQSSDDVRSPSRQTGNLQRNYTAPELRTAAAAAAATRTRRPSRGEGQAENLKEEFVEQRASPAGSTRKPSVSRDRSAIESDVRMKLGDHPKDFLEALHTTRQHVPPPLNFQRTPALNETLAARIPSDTQMQGKNIAAEDILAAPLAIADASMVPHQGDIVTKAKTTSAAEAVHSDESMLNSQLRNSPVGLATVENVSSKETRALAHDQRSSSTTRPGPESQVTLVEALSERPRSQTPVPSNYTTPQKTKSLKDRLRRALSFSSRSELSDAGAPEAKSTGPENGRTMYTQTNRSTDNMSIASTASSASMMLRKMSHGFTKKTKRSVSSIFSGSSKAKDRGDAADADGRAATMSSRPSMSSVSYVYAEPDIQPSNTSGHGRMRSSVSSITPIPEVQAVTSITEAVADVDGHGSVSFPRLSEEITVEEDRNRRASVHLERPLPIDSAERVSPARSNGNSPVSGRRRVSAPVTSLHSPGFNAFNGKGILKKTFDPLAHRTSLVETPGQPGQIAGQASMSDFDISFAPAPSLTLDSFGGVEQSKTPLHSRSSSVPATPTGEFSSTTGINTALKFSPRVTVHDTYTSLEYDRRGEIATCNRLTPLLAQRIKEELNAYKMDEMDVAEESRAHTHFFS